MVKRLSTVRVVNDKALKFFFCRASTTKQRGSVVQGTKKSVENGTFFDFMISSRIKDIFSQLIDDFSFVCLLKFTIEML